MKHCTIAITWDSDRITTINSSRFTPHKNGSVSAYFLPLHPLLYHLSYFCGKLMCGYVRFRIALRGTLKGQRFLKRAKEWEGGVNV